MENFIIALTENPVLYIGYFLSAVGAVGFLVSVGGFFSGIGHLFNYNESADHMDHSRTRSLWGLYLCMAALGTWEIIRVILGEAPVSSTLVLAAVLLSPAWIPWLKSLFAGKPNGH